MEDGKNKMQDLKVLYETNHIIVIEKPVNVPSQGDKTGDTDCLSLIKDYLKEKYQKKKIQTINDETLNLYIIY